MTLHRPLPAIFAIAVVACGGNVRFEATDASGRDASNDAVDAACVTPVQGTNCSKSDVPCGMVGDACCIGYVWACLATGPAGADVWTKEGLGCACVADAAIDTPIEVSPVDANPTSCPVDWTAATTGDHNALCATSIGCEYPQGACTCAGFCGGPARPDADLSPQWSCTSRRTDGCAETAPNDGDVCTIAGQACTYGPCCVTTYTCTTGHWNAGPQECPL
ncbi:MAG: hypothetical protein ACHREM_17275 [Polyangiales bacterium]